MRNLVTLFVVLVLSSCANAQDASEHNRDAAARLPEMTILSTMVANFVGVGEWGFSLLLEFDDESILFDTGFKSDTVSQNAKFLNKDLSKVSTVILTHFHSDHTGGLLSLRRELMVQNPNAISTVYVSEGFFRQRYDQSGTPTYSLQAPGFTEAFQSAQQFRAAAEALGIEFIVLAKYTQIRPGVTLTGPVPRVHDERNVNPGFFLKDNAGVLTADTVPDSQVLGLQTDQGWVLISGCGHAGIVNAAEQLQAIKPMPIRMALGGFHLFKASEETISWTGAALKRFGVEKLIGAHCTGVHATHKLADILELPKSSVSVGAIGTRIDPALMIIPSSVE